MKEPLEKSLGKILGEILGETQQVFRTKPIEKYAKESGKSLDELPEESLKELLENCRKNAYRNL